MPAFEKSERVFVDLLEFEHYRDTDGKYGEKDAHNEFYREQLIHDISSSLPGQIEKFFEMQKYELEAEEYSLSRLEERAREIKEEEERKASEAKERPRRFSDALGFHSAAEIAAAKLQINKSQQESEPVETTQTDDSSLLDTR